MVYDCGSSTGTKILTDEIRSTFCKDEKIDLLFISHFHVDHINGIDYLLDYCDVKYILLPLQSEYDKIYTLIDNYYNSYEESDIILDSVKFVRGRAEIIFVRPEGKNEDTKLEIGKLEGLKLLEQAKFISSGTKVYSSKYVDWYFIPFNFRQESRAKVLKRELLSQLIQ